MILKKWGGDFPGGPMVKISPSNGGGASSIPGRGAKIPRALRPKNQNIKQKQYCNKFNKDFKNSPPQKKIFKKFKRGEGECNNKVSFTSESVSEPSVHLEREMTKMHQNIRQITYKRRIRLISIYYSIMLYTRYSVFLIFKFMMKDYYPCPLDTLDYKSLDLVR